VLLRIRGLERPTEEAAVEGLCGLHVGGVEVGPHGGASRVRVTNRHGGLRVEGEPTVEAVPVPVEVGSTLTSAIRTSAASPDRFPPPRRRAHCTPSQLAPLSSCRPAALSSPVPRRRPSSHACPTS